jgi:hypothetical protein
MPWPHHTDEFQQPGHRLAATAPGSATNSLEECLPLAAPRPFCRKARDGGATDQQWNGLHRFAAERAAKVEVLAGSC